MCIPEIRRQGNKTTSANEGLFTFCLHLASFSLSKIVVCFSSMSKPLRKHFKDGALSEQIQKIISNWHYFKMEMGWIHSCVLPLIRVVSRSSSILISRLWIQFHATMMSQYLAYERTNLSYFWITHLETWIFLYFHISRVALNLILAPFLSINHCCIS